MTPEEAIFLEDCKCLLKYPYLRDEVIDSDTVDITNKYSIANLLLRYKKQNPVFLKYMHLVLGIKTLFWKCYLSTTA